MRPCRTCKAEKKLDDFPKRKPYKDGVDTQCRACCNKYKLEWCRKNPDRTKHRLKLYYQKNKERLKEKSRNRDPLKIRDYELRTAYGISLQQYEEMLRKQDGKCAICKRPETRKSRGKVRNLSVDHNHKTGKVRKLLCNLCNRVLGLAEEDSNRLVSMISYLQEHQ